MRYYILREFIVLEVIDHDWSDALRKLWQYKADEPDVKFEIMRRRT